MTEAGGTVRYTEPEAKQEDLPKGTLLPMLHTIRSLAAARAGTRMMVVPLFDGTSADGAQDTTTVISAWQPPAANANFPDLAKLGSARMRVAFFDRKDSGAGGGASAPDYPRPDGDVGVPEGQPFEVGVVGRLDSNKAKLPLPSKIAGRRPRP